MPVIKPITDLRNTNEISELCHTQQQFSLQKMVMEIW